MGLRDDNFLIDSDLQTIVSAFEKGLVRAEDVDATVALFRRPLEDLAVIPTIAGTILDNTPGALPESPIGDGGGEEIGLLAETKIDAVEGGEEEEEENFMLDIMKKWGKDCLPCDLRIFTTHDADFFKDLETGWKDALDKIDVNLGDFDLLMEDTSLEGLITKVCAFADLLKFQCVPDIEKLLFLLRNLLQANNMEFSLSMGKVDELLMGILGPLLNELAAQLSLIGDLIGGPIKCIIDAVKMQISYLASSRAAGVSFVEYMRREGLEVKDDVTGFMSGATSRAVANRSLRDAAEAQQEWLSGTTSLRRDRNQRDSTVTVRREPVQPTSLSRRDDAPPSGSSLGEGEGEGDSPSQRPTPSPDETNQAQTSRLQSASRFADRLSQEASLRRLNTLLSRGISYLMAKKDYVLGMIEGLVNNSILERWNSLIPFAKDKTDILMLLSIGKAIKELADQGQISCGVDLEEITEEEAAKIYNRLFVGTAMSYNQMTVVDGNIEAVRNVVPQRAFGGRPGEGEETSSNIVVRRPLSSCLKKISSDDADKVSLWISQLEGAGS